ncbi:MAG: hypothetical protein DRR16_25015 [Candidatus Parabeggiatoa sp. nov. 3]|nr:MAG: hypothetical protein DRR00_27625 [Gammaproteobacteria bacterium]RKZ60561.1 MAG: hypothetical protein DRQ99_21910 [Gammaproteobacteria bacterium]RKZ79831.1 MAG: hypothetical protein DRR16_25015 [Gammaproteobacteria bacterium]HEW98883.1 hypothetical protein [Beggiatoa sp.]
MKTANFKEWSLTKLDKTFDLTQILSSECGVLQSWQARAKTIELTEFEQQILLDLQAPLIWAGKAWNETELENKFISPLIMAAKIDDRQMGYFLERALSGIVGDYTLSGLVDGMIAKGLREPEIPWFCMHEYKRSVDNEGNPDAQALAAMLVAREKNANQKPVYGLYIVGSIWNFMVLNLDNSYCVSENYDASNKGIFSLFGMIKAVKVIIQEEYLRLE